MSVQEGCTFAPSQKEIELIPQDAPEQGHQDDQRQFHQPHMGHETRQDQDGFPLQEGSQKECPVSIALHKRFKF